MKSKKHCFVTATTSGCLASLIVASLLTGHAQSELLQNGGFENGSAGWTLSGGCVVGEATQYAHVGSRSLWLGGALGQRDKANQTIYIPNTVTDAALSFYLNVTSQEHPWAQIFDTLEVTVRDASGNILAALGPCCPRRWSNVNQDSGIGDYHQETYDLLPYRGQLITLQFTSENDSFSNPTWFVLDDVSVNVAEADYSVPYKFTTLAGEAGGYGSADGTRSGAQFGGSCGAAADNAGNVYVADWDNHTIRKVTPAGLVTTLAGLAGNSGATDGTGKSARFYHPWGVAVDGGGHVYVGDTYNCTIRRITAGGMVTTLAGSPGWSGSTDGSGRSARFSSPQGVAVDGMGTVYVADTGNHTIRRVSTLGLVTTLAGLAGISGSSDGARSDARFNQPRGLALDSGGNLYVADTANQTIRKITPTGVVTTLAGEAAEVGSSDGMGKHARFNGPRGVVVDNAGNMFIGDRGNNTIRRIAPSGTVSTVAGLWGTFGSADGIGAAASFNEPIGVAVDNAGNLYVADDANSTIRKGWLYISPAFFSGDVSVSQREGSALVDMYYNLTGAGSDYSVTVLVSADAGATFNTPASHFTGDGLSSPTAPGTGKHIVWDAGSDLGPGLFQSVVLRVASGGSSATSAVLTVDLRRPWIVSQPESRQSAQAGSSVAFTVSAAGTPPLTYQWRKNGVDIPAATAATLTLNAVTAADSGQYSVLVRNAYGQAESRPASLAVLEDGASGVARTQITAKPAPAKQENQNSLVVITHGWEILGLVGPSAEWIDDMADTIRNELSAQGKMNWQVVPIHWESLAGGLPEMALANARVFGAVYGAEFAQVHWHHVHLIGHSAGSAFIEAFAKEIKAIWPDTVVHCTFLDPYLTIASVVSDLGLDTYGQNADWSDSYFSDDWTGVLTGGKLKHAYNVDVTWRFPGVERKPVYCASQSSTAGSTPPTILQCGVKPYSPGLAAGHEWPYKFYTQTVTEGLSCATDMGLPAIGFGLSQEADGWAKHSGLGPNNDPVMLCPPADAVQPKQAPAPNQTWDLLRIQDSPHAGSGTWEFNGGNSFILNVSSGHGLARSAAGARSVAPMDTPSGEATASWLAVAVTITNPANFVQFDAAFASPAGSEGLLTVYWNTNQIGLADERVTDPGLQNYRFALPAAVTNGLYSLSFRLDAFHATSSSVTVTNVTTGFYGLLEAPILSWESAGTNSAPVLKVTAPAGFDCVVLNSTNLVDWAPAAVLVNTNGTAYYPLPTESAASAQFYRAVIP